ncbi:hypothetical protein [Aeromicrobium sp. CTD01-1L150]
MRDDEAVIVTPRRVRHDLADSLLVMGFSLTASVLLAGVVAVVMRLL